MSAGYTKLFSSILDSTIWLETNPTRIVWITMMAKADQFGEVAASVPGLAHAACVSIEECQAALKTFLAPDKHSRTKDFDGRRIEVIDGGWRLLNHSKYREKMRSLSRTEYLREKQAESRARRALSTNVNTSTIVNQSQPISEAEAEADKTQKAGKPPRARAVFVSPILADWLADASARFPRWPITDATSAWNHYEANGWRVGKNPMKNWHAALSNCAARSSTSPNFSHANHRPNPRSIAATEAASSAYANVTDKR